MVNNPLDIKTIVGAITSPHLVPGEFSSIVLTPDPEILFEKLQYLSPNIREIAIVFDPNEQEWLIQAAKKAADNMGYTLNLYPASLPQDIAKKYQNILPDINNTTAIWIVSPRLSSAVFAEILEVAWHRDLVVFSNNSSHVKQGVLFSLYPDNFSLGKSLAKLAISDVEIKHHLLKDVFMAINLRTADHLGLKLKKGKDYELSFPAQ
jgi:putative ABC transport system substrate-binding protein